MTDIVYLCYPTYECYRYLQLDSLQFTTKRCWYYPVHLRLEVAFWFKGTLIKC